MVRGITFLQFQKNCKQKLIKEERRKQCNFNECPENECPLWKDLLILEGKQKYGAMNDDVGKMPKIKSKKQALEEILHVSRDKRSHFMLEDVCDWLELKLRIVGVLARKGLKT